jgi:hypothetical protein
MSHGILKVNLINTDSTGNIPLTLSSMGNGSATSNQVLTYDGSNFVPADPSSSKGYNLKFSTFQKSEGYNVTGSSTYAYNAGDYSIWRCLSTNTRNYTDTGFSANSSTTTNSPIANSAWLESLDIPNAGTYLVTCAGVARSSSIVFQLESNSGAFSARIMCDRSNKYGTLAAGILTTTGSDIVRLVVKETTGTVVLADDDDHYFFTFNILKLG